MKLYTHDGVFHADEVFASVVLLKIFNQDRIERVSFISNEVKEMEEKGEAIVYDIGGGRYDHHQKGGNGYRVIDEEENPKGFYSSFGLIWREFGQEYCQKVLVNSIATLIYDINIEELSSIIDSTFVSGIDAIDTGEYKTEKGSVRILNVSNIISLCNKDWYEDFDLDGLTKNLKKKESKIDFHFQDGLWIARNILEKVVKNEAAKLAAKDIVIDAINNAKDGIMTLEYFVPWQSPVQEYGDEILFIVFPSMRGGWNVQAVPPFAGSRDQKIPFPVNWRGVKELPGIPDFIFCHPAGCIAGAESKESCIKMAKMAIEQAE